MAKRAVIDIVNRRLHLCGPGDLKIDLPPGSQFSSWNSHLQGRCYCRCLTVAPLSHQATS
eukprot:5648139-Lingulodinium_polyedra.AAC.1